MMRSTTTIISLIIFATSALAATPVTLNDCLDSALRNNLTLAAANMSVEKSNVMKGTAFNPSQTGIALTQESTSGDSPDNGLTFSQDFDFPTVYIARHKLLKAEASLETARRDMVRAQTLGEVSSLYNELLHARLIRNLLAKRVELARETSRIVRIRLENGETGNLDMLGAEDLCEAIELELIEADRNVAEKNRLLAKASGFDTPIEPTGDLAPLPLPEMLLPSFDATPSGRMAEALTEVDSRNISIARQAFMPGISLAATTKLYLKGFNPYNIEREPFRPGNFMKFEVGVSVPLFFFAERASLKAAQIDARANMLSRLDEKATYEAEWASTRDRIITLDATLSRYKGSMLERAKEMERIAKAAYDLGEVSFEDYASRSDRLIELKIKIADTTNEYNKAVIAFNQMQGLL